MDPFLATVIVCGPLSIGVTYDIIIFLLRCHLKKVQFCEKFMYSGTPEIRSPSGPRKMAVFSGWP